jgi:polysaccharide export outer membrane protein
VGINLCCKGCILEHVYGKGYVMTRLARRLHAVAVFAGCCWLWIGSAAAQQGAGVEDEYRVKPGDELNVSVWGEENLNQPVLIRPDGGFSFPLAGDLTAAGKTVEQIRIEISERLAQFIPDLVATVTVTAINGNRIYVIGQVDTPGTYVMNPRLDVMQALSVAGGTTPFAKVDEIRILRRTAQGQTVLPFSFTDVSKGRNLDQNVVLESGDVVVVP